MFLDHELHAIFDVQDDPDYCQRQSILPRVVVAENTYAEVALAAIITVIIVFEEKSNCDLMTVGSNTPELSNATPNRPPATNSRPDMVF